MTDFHAELSTLPALYKTDGKKGDLPAVYLFTPAGAATWVIWEYDPETKVGFGLCDLGMGFPEIGYVSVAEIEDVRDSYGLAVEIDKGLDTRFKGYGNAGIDVPSYLIGVE